MSRASFTLCRDTTDVPLLPHSKFLMPVILLPSTDLLDVFADITADYTWSYDFLCKPALAFAQVMVVFKQLNAGFGKSQKQLYASEIEYIQKASVGYVADILFMLAVCGAKGSLAWFTARLSPDLNHQYVCNGLFCLSLLWGIAGAVALSIRCDLHHPWSMARCSGLLLRWRLIVGFDILTELALFFLTVYLVCGLRMSRQKKRIVVLGFSFRLPLIALAILHVYYVGSTIHSTNASFDQIIPSIYEQVEMGWSLIAATIPCLKGFVADLGTGYLGHNLGNSALQYGSNRYESSNRDAYMLDTLTSSHVTRSRTAVRNADNISNRSLTRPSRSIDREFSNEDSITRAVDHCIQ
ncbi:hypothetical protein F5884DRAFT_857144 [Xylogone sp. PMI_703]|nr:hypothetical protein F5884DRAFT_857144 [Xylogone sp. PMI_703]